MTIMTSGMFSSKNMFTDKLEEIAISFSLDSSIELSSEEITSTTEKFSGSDNTLFDFYKYEKEVSTILDEVKARSLFLANFKKLKLPRDFLNEIELFRLKLLFWSDFCSESNIRMYKDPTWYFTQCLSRGPEFGLWMKDFYDYSIRKTMATNLFSLPDGQEAISLEDLNEIYPPNHLIMWMQNPDYNDVLGYSFKEPRINNSIRSEIRYKIRENMNKIQYFREFTYSDQINMMNNKKCSKDFGSDPSYRVKNLTKDYPEYLSFDISHVTKTSCESRICAIANDLTRNLLRNSRKICDQLFKGKKMNYYGKKPWKAESQLHEKDGRTFIMYDQKKCGWTFPMEFLADTFEIAAEETEMEEFSILAKIYKDKKIFYHINGETYCPVRGFTLGMWDNVLSFIMECIFSVYVEKYANDQITDYISGMFFGDDAVIIIDQPDDFYIDCQSIWNHFLTYLMEIGLEINTKKSFAAKSGIFCEMYGDNSTFYNHKLAYYLLSGLDILSKRFTFERKVCLDSWYQQMQAYSTFLDKKELLLGFVNSITKYIIKHTEVEFDAYDHYFPIEAGGWLTEKVDGKSTFLLRASNEEFRENRLNLYTCKSFQDFVCSLGGQDNNAYLYKKIIREEIDLIDLDKILDQLIVRKFNYYNNMSNKRKVSKVKQWYENKRKDLFQQKKLYRGSIMTFIYQKGCGNQHFPKDMFKERGVFNGQFMRGLKQIPHKYSTGFNEDLLSSLELVYKYKTTPGKQNVRRDNIANIYKDISGSKFPIPISWLKFCLSHGLSIEELYSRLMDDGIDILKCEPTIACKLDDMSTDIYPCSNEIAYWDDITCTYYEISYEDADKIRYKSYQEASEYLYNKYNGDLGLEYFIYESHMSLPFEEEDSDEDPENIEDIIRELSQKPVPEEKHIESFVGRNVISSIEDLQLEEEYHDPYGGYDSDNQEEVVTSNGYYRGEYVTYLDPDHEDYDETIVSALNNNEELDPIAYYVEIQEYPVLGAFRQEYSEDENPD